MKILHTADWHIGKQLYGVDLDEDISLFVEWLLDFIEKEKIDVLLVSGDVFDQSNPSNAAKKIWFDALKALHKLSVYTIVTGGNHDSVSLLDASSQVLNLLDIYTIGGCREDLEEMVVHIERHGQECVILPVPFIRDKDVRKASDQVTMVYESERNNHLKSGMYALYEALLQLAKTKYPNVPVIAMGHLFVAGSDESDSERDIKVGGASSVEAQRFASWFDYTALGHIHRPQSFCDGRVKYCGSPISLSFSEYNDAKTVIVIEVQGEKLQSQSIAVPKWRKLLRISGSLEKVISQLGVLSSSGPLETLIEIEVKEAAYSITVIEQVRSLVSNFNTNNAKIIRDRIYFENSPRQLSSQIYAQDIKDLTPTEVFQKKLEIEAITEEIYNELMDSFLTLMSEIEAEAQA